MIPFSIVFVCVRVLFFFWIQALFEPFFEGRKSQAIVRGKLLAIDGADRVLVVPAEKGGVPP